MSAAALKEGMCGPVPKRGRLEESVSPVAARPQQGLS